MSGVRAIVVPAMMGAALFGRADMTVAAGVSGLEEVLVTANRREQSQQDVPISLIAMTGERMAKEGVGSFEDLARSIPSVTYTDLGPGQSVILIRGIGGNTFQRDTPNDNKATVGVYLDDVPLSIALSTPDIDSFDMARVEVLRGPQGTLFGAGSLSGTIRFISNRPSSEPQAAVEVGVADTQDGDISYEGKSMVNLPLGDTLALRAVATYVDRGGYIDSFFDNGQRRQDVNDLRKLSARVALSWRPTANLTIMPRVLYQKDETGGSPLSDIYSRNSDSAAGVYAMGAPGFVGQPIGGDLEQFRQLREGFESEFRLADLNVSYDFGGATLVSTTSYIDRDIVALRDLQFFWGEFGSTAPFLPLGIGRVSTNPPRGISSLLTDSSSVESVAQEIRLVSDTDGPLQWLVGGFVLDQTVTFNQVMRSPGFGSLFAPGLSTLLNVPQSSVQGIINQLGLGEVDAPAVTQQSLDLRQLALFSEATYWFTPHWGATLGVRWFSFKEDKDFTFAGYLQGRIDQGVSNYEEDGTNPRLILSYKPNERMLFSAQASRGFRPGGTNEQLNPLCAPDLAALGLSSGADIKSDTVWNYEVNAKTRTRDGRWGFNASVFHMKYRDLLATLRLTCGQAIRTNVGDATSEGVELELTGQPADGWFVSLSGSYIDATLDRAPPQFPGQAGDRIPQSPEYMLNVLARYTRPVLDSRYNAYLQASVQSLGDKVAFFRSRTAFEPVSNELSGYTLGNLRIGLEGERWDASLWVDNVTNEIAELSIESEFRLSRRAVARNRPRTVGLSLSYSF